MESDHITKEDKETERIKKNALARKQTKRGGEMLFFWKKTTLFAYLF